MAMTSGYHLPEDIIFKIFLLLPVLSLLRCKSVCKSWLSIISDPYFIQTHLNISNTEQSSLLNMALVLSFLVVVRDKHDGEQSLVYVHNGKYFSSIFFDVVSVRLIGCCDGLVCLSDYLIENICVWNPSNRRFKMLPTPNKKTSSGPVRLGFGYDSVSDDYNFVRILFSDVNSVVETELYSVNED